jgi:isopentenyl diphosphate isomerase/L-lactate dehydrogenase-like FMN-dependent dehydrogenase
MSSSEVFRREFLRFLAASPLLAQQTGTGPAGPADAINVMDFEPLAHKLLPPAHWGYLSTGVVDDLTLGANREAMEHYQLRARRLSGVVTPDLRTEVLGMTLDLPFYVSAVGHQKQFHPEGELAVARATKAQKTMQMLSTVTTTPVEDVARERGSAPWYQLYMPATWDETEKMVHRAEEAGCKALFWTIDTLAGRNTETLTRLARTDTRDCMSCHASHPIGGSVTVRNKGLPMFAGLSGEMNPPAADWGYVSRLKKLTTMKVLLKGIDTAEDAALARENGADGVVVSNHGGRATETGRGTIDILPEVVDAVKGQIPVLVDGGFRRGTDIYKALALGAKAVGVGRPYIWGLTAYGQPGVERVIEILRAELVLTMRQCGTPSVAKMTRDLVLRKSV